MINDRQFIITGKVIDGLKSIKLDKKVLNYQAKLPIHTNKDNSVIIIGDAWQADMNQQSPYEIIKGWNSGTLDNDVYKIEESWCGRYVLIVGDRLYQDFASQFCTFYDNKGNISSSLNMMTEIFGGGGYVDPKIRHGIGMNYIPGPFTPYKNIKKVMCSQVLNINTMEVYERPILFSSVKKLNDRTIKEFSAYFIHSLQEMRKTIDGEIKMALTGGYDSRTLLSMIYKAGFDFSCYTFETEYTKGGGDFIIPSILCEKLGIKHQLIRMGEFDKVKYNAYIKHTAGMANDGDLRHYTYGQYDELSRGKKINVLYSGIWESFIEYYKKHSNGFQNEPLLLDDIFKAFPDTKLDELKIKGFQWFLENKDINKFTTDRNRFYFEERDGCWMSYIAQGFDMINNVQMYQPCNCRLFASYLLAFNFEERVDKIHQQKIIAYNCPKIMDIPYADAYPSATWNLKKKIKNKLRTYYYYMKWYGVKSLIR